MACVSDGSGEFWNCDSSLDWADLMNEVSSGDEDDPTVRALVRTLSSPREAVIWVHEHIKFQDDPKGIELIRAPADTIGAGSGDCDDQARLLRALLRAGGVDARYAWWLDSLGNLAHVAVRVGDDILDSTMPFDRVITHVR